MFVRMVSRFASKERASGNRRRFVVSQRGVSRPLHTFVWMASDVSVHTMEAFAQTTAMFGFESPLSAREMYSEDSADALL